MWEYAAGIITAAGATRLTLSAFALVLVTWLVMHLLRGAPVAIRAVAAFACLIIVVLVLFVLAKDGEVPSQPSLAMLNVAGLSTVYGRSFTLDLGPVPNDAPTEVELRLATDGGNPLKVSLVSRDRVKASWQSGAPVAEVGPVATAALLVRFEPRKGETGNVRSDVSFVNGSREIYNLTVTALPVASRVAVQDSSGSVSSGLGQDYSRPYEACIRAPTPYYILDRASVRASLTGDRSCEGWSTCQVKYSGDGEACFIFTLQGHNERDHGKGIGMSTGEISGAFVLKAQPPTLYASR